MSLVLDPCSDKNLVMFHRVNSTYNIPEFVKQASVDSFSDETVKQLPAAAFADPAYRQFPTHTKAATYLSYTYFLHEKDKMSKTAADCINYRLQQAIDNWAIRDNCNVLHSEFIKSAAQTEEALTDDHFAMVETRNGNNVRRLPIVTKEHVKQAAEHLFENRDKYPYEWRKRAARKILVKASQLGARIPSVYSGYINKCAGYGFNAQDKIASALFDRAVLMNGDSKLKGTPVHVSVVKLAKAVASNTLTPVQMEKTASLIADIDVETGMYKLYTRGLPTPEEVVFEITEKRASDVKDHIVQLTTGTIYKKSDIAKASFEPFKMLGDDVMGEISDPFGKFDLEKAANILFTLPRNDAALYEKGMQLLGVQTDQQLRKSAGLPDNVSDWTNNEWAKYVNMTVGK